MQAPPQGDAPGADIGLCSWPGIDLAVCLQDSGGKLDFNPPRAANLLFPLPQGVPGSKSPLSPLLGIPLALPIFTSLLIVLAGKARGRKYKK